MSECTESTHYCPRVIEKLTMSLFISHGQRNKDFCLFLFRIFHEQSEQNQLSEFGKTYKWYLFKDKFEKQTYKINSQLV